MKKGTYKHSKKVIEILRENAKGNSNFKTFLKNMSPEKRESWLIGYRKKISKQHTPERKARARISMSKFMLGNSYRKDFLKRLNPLHRELFLKEVGKKISLGIYNNHEYMERLRERMQGNTIMVDYLKRNPVYTPPDWQNYTPNISVPLFVPILEQRLSVPQQVGYYCSGLMPRGLL